MAVNFIKTLPYYGRIWWRLAVNEYQNIAGNRFANLLFIIGKTLRFFLMMIFIFTLQNHLKFAERFADGSLLTFFLIYQFLDGFSQFLFRHTYIFAHQVRTGQLDFFLINPGKTLFFALFGKPDLNDLIFLIPSTALSGYLIFYRSAVGSSWQIWAFLLFLINSLIILAAIHIFILSLGVISAQGDGFIWIFRNLSRFGQFPVAFYPELWKMIFFYILPIGIIFNLPTEILLGRPFNMELIILLAMSLIFLKISLLVWQRSLRSYTGAGG